MSNGVTLNKIILKIFHYNLTVLGTVMSGTHTKSILQLGYPKKTFLGFIDKSKYLYIYHNLCLKKMSFLDMFNF